MPQIDQQTSTDQHLSLVPLGAGDLIDRAVRFYRGNFWTFVMIAAPPVVVGTIISVAWTFLARSIFSVSAGSRGLDLTLYYVFVWFGSLAIWFTQTVAVLSVMGGASRNFVRHLLFSEPLSFRQTYSNTWQRLAGLIVASSIITVLLGLTAFVTLYLGGAVGALIIVLAAAALQMVPPLAVLVCIVLALALAVGLGWLFFLVASRFAYIPQVMLVEGQGVFSSIGRSVSLASGNVTRLAALFVFTTLATFFALAVLYIPLIWIAWWFGVDIVPFDGAITSAWYEIASQVMWQASIILLTPVWMVGLCLLYVDERVRFEGYEIPSVPAAYVNPLQPALADRPVPEPPPPSSGGRGSITTLGLK